MNSVTIVGVAAQIRWGYQCAATLGSWTLDPDGSLVATWVWMDAFRVSQSPLTLVVGSWVRPLEGLQIAGRTLSARVRPQEITHEMSLRSA